ncbi:MAG: hypothetical protein J6T99_06120 [Oscillospiraceae bacterium]|nr:hypothetical protein [Oscillospiraceae bacterium]
MEEMNNVNMHGYWENEPVEEPVTYTNVASDEAYKTVDISKAKEEPGKQANPEDVPWKRKYLYGLDETGCPVSYRYIPKSKFDVWEIRKNMDIMLAGRHDIAMIFMVDNSKNLHEAFNRAKSGYRPVEDRAIFVEMLYQYGIKLFPVYAIDSIE